MCYIKQIIQKPIPLPEGKRVPFGLDYLTIPSDGTPVKIFFSNQNCPSRGKIKGLARIRISYPLQPFDLKLTQDVAQRILSSGLYLVQTEGFENTVFFSEKKDSIFSIRILFEQDYADATVEFKNRLFSLSSLQPFGWMEGRVLDGLYTLYEGGNAQPLNTIRSHIGTYIRQERLIYEDPRSRVCDDTIYGIEACLPFAIITNTGIGKEVLPLFIQFIETFKSKGVISDSDFISAEGAYTIAYPLAVVSVLQNDPLLAERAIQELLIRKQMLRCGNDLYLRCSEKGRSFKNWGRAFVWYMMGLVQVMGAFKKAGISYLQELIQELRNVAEIASNSLSNGLCPVFLGEEETGTETSGNAGIAVALFLGINSGLLNSAYFQIICRTYERLTSYLTPDGMLCGASQSNKGGEQLQRCGYRVISPMAMGLMAHILGMGEVV